MKEEEQRIADLYEEFCILNRRNPNHPTHRLNPETDKARGARVAREKVKPEDFPEWTNTFVKNYPDALIEPIPADASAKELLAFSNGEKLAPPANPIPKPSPVHPTTGRSYWDVIEKHKAEAAAKKEKQRKTRNPFLASHLSNAEDADD